MQREREPLGGAERVEDHEQGGADGVGQERFVLGVATSGDALDPLRHAGTRRFLASGRTRAQHVQRHPCHDRRQPPTKVLDLVRVRPAEPEPGFLHGVIGLAPRTEHPVGDCPQMRTVALEPVHQPLVFRHRSDPPSRSVIPLTIQTGSR